MANDRMYLVNTTLEKAITLAKAFHTWAIYEPNKDLINDIFIEEGSFSKDWVLKYESDDDYNEWSKWIVPSRSSKDED